MNKKKLHNGHEMKAINRLTLIVTISIFTVNMGFPYNSKIANDPRSTSEWEEIKIEDSVSPLSEAIRIITEKTGVPITYEEPPLLYHGDLTRDQNGTIWPKNKSLQFRYTRNMSLNEILRELLISAYEQGVPGRFQIKRIGGLYHIIPIQYRDERGNWKNTESILDIPVSIWMEHCYGITVLSEVIHQIEKRTGKKITTNLINEKFVEYKYYRASNQKARNYIIHIIRDLKLEKEGRKPYWHILYDPRYQGWYIINFSYIDLNHSKGYKNYNGDSNFPNEQIKEHDREVNIKKIPIPVTKDMIPPRLIKGGKEEIEKILGKSVERIRGLIVISLEIDDKGKPYDVYIYISRIKMQDSNNLNRWKKIDDKELENKIIRAIESWIYEPSRKDGKEVPVIWHHIIRFHGKNGISLGDLQPKKQD